MPRLGRVVVPNYPHHIGQRGHNKQVVFAQEADLRYYLSTLEAFKALYNIKVYGFCLMTNHVHLILQPGEVISGLGQLTETERFCDEIEAIIERRIVNRKQGRPR
jgi:putative transposase